MDKKRVIRAIEKALKNNIGLYTAKLARLMGIFGSGTDDDNLCRITKIARYEYLDDVWDTARDSLGLPSSKIASDSLTSPGSFYLVLMHLPEYDDDAEALDSLWLSLILDNFNKIYSKETGDAIDFHPSMFAKGDLGELVLDDDETHNLKEILGAYFLCGRQPALAMFIEFMDILIKKDPDGGTKKSSEIYKFLKNEGMFTDEDDHDFVIKGASILDETEGKG